MAEYDAEEAARQAGFSDEARTEPKQDNYNRRRRLFAGAGHPGAVRRIHALPMLCGKPISPCAHTVKPSA
ncbi:hypothetical protein FJU30_14120 [Affinibrenneria salicis]|uniref:Uncharacterized protein n=1 Tax=Affinibrenneria salicis TaxID=2590031 RepID=A0A5J5FZR9_9GAMM|nr:hypothetical protein [Affinibrenneria salicis]KAA8999463.1 hypothetical protein FJU30_14120 [Affinibrenneria salicis]